jgi:hypothetical protein
MEIVMIRVRNLLVLSVLCGLFAFTLGCGPAPTSDKMKKDDGMMKKDDGMMKKDDGMMKKDK